MNNDRNPWWALAIIILAGANYAGVIASAQRQLFAMSLWLFTYIFMGMAPYVQYRLAMTPGTTPHVDESLFPVAGLLVLGSCVAVMIGRLLAGRSRLPVKALRQSYVNRRRANLLTLAGILIFAYYASQVGVQSFLLSRDELAAVRRAVWPNITVAQILTGALQMGLLVGFLAQMAVRQQRRAAGLQPALLPALINGLLLLYAVNPISTTRYVFGTAILAVLAAFGVYATLIRFRIMAAAAIAGMLTLFPLADRFRTSDARDFQTEGPVKALTSGDFDAFAQLTNTLSYVADHGIAWGDQLVGVLFLWVPRSIWPGKPIDTGVELAEYMGYKFTNLSAPIWAELFINFGLLGALLGMGALGYLFRRWDTRTDLYLRISRMPPVVVSAVAFYLIIFLRGSMLAVSAYLLVILVSAWFVTYRRRTTGRILWRVPHQIPRHSVGPAGPRPRVPSA
ncbi:hypothetical protein [Kocuria arenosa]|uniref:hypothetical protein n=1 Tax=Kocuria arenosa TaxID=3071446 RepID=UPI0034D5F895